MKYTVVIEEILRKEVVVEAENSEEAKEIAEALYRKGEIVLDAGGNYSSRPTKVFGFIRRKTCRTWAFLPRTHHIMQYSSLTRINPFPSTKR